MRNWKIMDLKNTLPIESKSLILSPLTLHSKFQPLFRGNNPNDTPITVPTIIQASVIKNGIKRDEPSQNVAKSHLEDPISTTTNLDETYPLNAPCQLLPILESPSFSSEIQDYSSVDSVEMEFLPESEGQLDHTNLSPTDVFSEHHDYKLFLLQKELDAPNDNPNIMTFIPVRFKMTSSSLPPPLATPLHYPNSWNNTTMKTMSPLFIQVQYQPLPKLHVIIPSNLSVLITQWISQCNGSSSSIQFPSQG